MVPARSEGSFSHGIAPPLIPAPLEQVQDDEIFANPDLSVPTEAGKTDDHREPDTAPQNGHALTNPCPAYPNGRANGAFCHTTCKDKPCYQLCQEQAKRLQILEDQVANRDSFEGLVGISPEMKQVFARIRRVAGSNTTVLIQGETGTGKELVAKAIHNLSDRRDGRFMPINCGALSESILESELFGYEKGAFTGANKLKYGLIEHSSGGTLFLDEIDDMSPALQVKLLRAIQEKEVMRVGGNQPVPVDLRVIASSAESLSKLMEEGRFRSDLYYRLSVMVMDLPPLRHRDRDVPLLAQHFLEVHAQNLGRPPRRISSEAALLLKGHEWPGNVRELANVMEQAVLMCDGEVVTVTDLPDQVQSWTSETVGIEAMSFRDAREQFERQYFMAALDRAEGIVTDAAKLAGINRRHFYEKMKRYSIQRI